MGVVMHWLMIPLINYQFECFYSFLHCWPAGLEDLNASATLMSIWVMSLQGPQLPPHPVVCHSWHQLSQQVHHLTPLKSSSRKIVSGQAVIFCKQWSLLLWVRLRKQFTELKPAFLLCHQSSCYWLLSEFWFISDEWIQPWFQCEFIFKIFYDILHSTDWMDEQSHK